MTEPHSCQPVSDWDATPYSAIDPIAAEWDALVPVGRSHLRSGFLHAVERGGFVQRPAYLLLRHRGGLAGVAYSYEIGLDFLSVLPERWRRALAYIAKVMKTTMTVRVCGSALSDAHSGVYLAPGLSEEAQAAALEVIARRLTATPRRMPVLCKDLDPQETRLWGPALQARGFFDFRLWPTMELRAGPGGSAGYQKRLRSKYRLQMRNDLKAGDALKWELRTDFAELAEDVTRLYRNVLDRADFKLETATPAFFAALSGWPQARLLTARDEAGKLIGVSVLILGGEEATQLFVGLDYEANNRYALYFNLFHRSLAAALDAGCRHICFGQDSYEFKTRLGAEPDARTGYLRFPPGAAHWFMKSTRELWMFEEPTIVPNHVFQDSNGPEKTAALGSARKSQK